MFIAVQRGKHVLIIFHKKRYISNARRNLTACLNFRKTIHSYITPSTHLLNYAFFIQIRWDIFKFEFEILFSKFFRLCNVFRTRDDDNLHTRTKCSYEKGKSSFSDDTEINLQKNLSRMVFLEIQSV